MTGPLERVDDFPVVGVVGGGQLARMLQQAAIGLGVQLRVLATDRNDSAGQVISDVRIGHHDDPVAVKEFADGCDVVTFDHEHVPPAILRNLIDHGVAVRPSPDALIHAQDKAVMRAALTEAGLPCPKWAILDPGTEADVARSTLDQFGERAGWPIIMKTSRGGYDGRGVWVADDLGCALDIASSEELIDGAVWLLEEKVDFTAELSAQIARSPHGQAVAYPVVRTVQTDGICTEVVAPAPEVSSDHAIAAQRIALQVAQALDVTGMLAVELFDTSSGLMINELAMRPHNSGHWTIDGAVTSQFENHLRAVLDLPLGSPKMTAEHAVMVNVLGTQRQGLYATYKHVLARDPQLKIHMYGKTARPGRKLGHVTAVGSDVEDCRDRAHHGADYISGVIDE